jgi:serine/threonine protein phosphatase PrpC
MMTPTMMPSLTRAFGFAALKEQHRLSAKPDVSHVLLDLSCRFLVLGSRALWAALGGAGGNQEAVDLVDPVQDPMEAAKLLAREAQMRGSAVDDEISCIVVRFKEV